MKITKRKYRFFILTVLFSLLSGSVLPTGSPFSEVLAQVEKEVLKKNTQEGLEKKNPQCTLELEVTGTVGVATLDTLERGFSRAADRGCGALLLLINTPGGSLPTTRKIVEKLLNAKIPVLCLVHPRGGHAGSAGAIIMQACHVSGAMEATNIGAATPVLATGQEIPKDLRNKMINDTVAWLEGVTKLRGRNLKFSREIVTEAKSLSAKEAVAIGAVDTLAVSKDEFLKFAEGKTVALSETTTTKIILGSIVAFEADARHNLLKLLADPQTSYMLFMGSLGLLYFEITHPGAIVPGVVGAIGLVISLISLEKLDVTWGGVALILLGVIFLIAEVFVTSFGLLGVTGVICFVMGSLFLFDEAKTGYALPIHLIGMTSVILGGLSLLIAYLAIRSRNLKPKGEFNDLVGQKVRIDSVSQERPEEGSVFLHGEIWKVRGKQPLTKDAMVEVKGFSGLTLEVELKSQLEE